MEGLIIEHLINKEQVGGKIGLFAKVTILPNNKLDYHEHHGETETYYIVSGEGLYDDNGKVRSVKAGETLFCVDGGGHAIECAGDEPLVFIALIV